MMQNLLIERLQLKVRHLNIRSFPCMLFVIRQARPEVQTLERADRPGEAGHIPFLGRVWID